jgi:hypothetical protein
MMFNITQTFLSSLLFSNILLIAVEMHLRDTPPSFVTDHRVRNLNNATGATSEAGNVYPSGVHTLF